MERWQKATVAVVGVLILGLFSFSVGFSLGNRSDGPARLIGSSGNPSSNLDVVGEAWDKIHSSALDPPSDRELARGAVKGMVETLNAGDDPYALFYGPDGYEAFQEYTSGRFSGIGVWLKSKAGRLEIVSVLPSTPALHAGLLRGDVIESVEAQPVTDISPDEAIQKIKGPAGSEVELTVDRGGRVLDFTLRRASIDLPNLVSRLEGGDLGYIRLFGFSDGAGSQVRERVDQLTTQGADGLILDLRDNGGGLFTEATEVASVFIEDGDIVTYRERSSPDVTYEAEGQAFDDVPLVVLVNEGTASASEIVAGALQDRDRAILVGVNTYGKGSVQEVVPLRDASALKLTTGAYLTPNGRDISGKGIEPDVEIDAEPAAQKDRAVEILKGIVVSTNDARG